MGALAESDAQPLQDPTSSYQQWCVWLVFTGSRVIVLTFLVGFPGKQNKCLDEVTHTRTCDKHMCAVQVWVFFVEEGNYFRIFPGQRFQFWQEC